MSSLTAALSGSPAERSTQTPETHWMHPVELDKIARTLRTAQKDRKAIPPPTTIWPALEADNAFQVQRINATQAILGGDRVVGMKLGNMAPATQEAFDLHEPTFGHIFSSTVIFEGASIRRSSYISPYVELQPAFLLREPLKGPNVTIAEVINAVECICPAVEILDSRIESWAVDLPSALADNAFTGSLILGRPMKFADLDLDNAMSVLYLDDYQIAIGNTRDTVGSPLAAIATLCRLLAKYGVGLDAGHWVLSGGCLQAKPMDRIGEWKGTITGVGSVEFGVL